MNETHEHVNGVHNLQVQVQPRSHAAAPPPGRHEKRTEGVDHEDAGATVRARRPPSIMLLTHIRFLKVLRSTASPNPLSLSHPALSHARRSDYSVCIQFLSGAPFSTQMLGPGVSRLTAFPVCCAIPGSTSTRLPCSLAETQSVQSHLRKSCLSEGALKVLGCSCSATPAAVPLPRTWLLKLGGVRHETRVPEVSKEPTPTTLPGAATTDKSGKPETSTPPLQMRTGGEVRDKRVPLARTGQSRRPPSSIIAVRIEQRSENRSRDSAAIFF